MRKRFPTGRLLSSILVAGSLVLVGCTNNDFDFNEIDATMGFGGDSLSIPNSTTDNIMLSDVLDIAEDGDVKILDNGDYVFQLAGNDVTPAHPNVAKVSLEPQTLADKTFLFTPPNNAKMRGAARVSGFIDQTLDPQEMVRYNGHSKEVEKLMSGEIEKADIGITLNLDHFRSYVSTIKELKIMLPGFFDISKNDVTLNQAGVSYTVAFENDGMGVTLSNVPTRENLVITIHVTKLNFEGQRANGKFGKLTINDNHDISLVGYFSLGLKADYNVSSADADIRISASVRSDRMTIAKATGIFNPDINIDLGKMDVTGIPDFLTDGNVVVDLDNPQILLTVSNDMEVAAKVGGSYKNTPTKALAYKNGQKIAEVDIPEIDIRKANGSQSVTTKVCICRNAAKIDRSAYDVVKEVANLSDLIKTIPDQVQITNINARADLSQTATFQFGHEYNVVPEYDVYAPIAFAENARIVYKDTVDGWNGDIKDFQLADKSYIEMTADVESHVPAYLNVTAQPIDASGKAISSDRILVEVPNNVNASPDGVTPVNSKLIVRLYQKDKDAMKELDGIIFDVQGSAASNGQTPVTGITLNSKTQQLRLRNIKVKVVGKVIGDFN